MFRTMLQLVRGPQAPEGAGVEKGATQPPHFHKRLMLPKFPASLVLPVVPALELPLAVALVDTPHPTPRPRAARYVLVSATSVLVLTEGPLLQAAFVPFTTSNSQPQEQSFLCSFVWHVLSPQKSRPPGLDVDSAQAGWYLLMWKVLYLGLRPGSGTGSRLRA